MDDKKQYHSKVGAKGQITLTKPIRDKLNLEKGDFVLMELKNGQVVVKKAKIEPVH